MKQQENIDWVLVDLPEKGDIAEHKAGLDPREVTRADGPMVWLSILGAEAGPFPASNYDFYRKVEVNDNEGAGAA